MNDKVTNYPSDGERTLISRSQFSLPESSAWKQILLLEDNSARAQRRKTAGVTMVSGSDVIVRFHRIGSHGISIAGENTYSPGTLSERVGIGGRTTLALELLDSIRASTCQSIVVAGPRYGGNQSFTNELQLRGLNWIVELPRRVVIQTDRHPEGKSVTDLLLSAKKWIVHDIALPITGKTITYSVVHLGFVPLGNGEYGQLFAAQTGAITGVHQGTIFAFSSMPTSPLDDLLKAVGWARWIRPMVRLEERSLLKIAPQRTSSNGKRSVELTLRSNIKLARLQDELALWTSSGEHRSTVHRGVLKQQGACLNVVELFAGAGGMGLGFLLAGGNAGGYRLGSSAEVHPIYVETLRANHAAFARFRDKKDVVPETLQPMDLRTNRSLDALEHSARQAGDTDVLIGGPPCQGFSNANRNSWHRANPHNELIDVFLRYVRRLKPKIFLMENVQGIVWTQKHGRTGGELTVVNSIAQRMARYGYLVFPKLLDAVWFGVPQYRSRFFLLGIHCDLGYRKDDFGEWGPYPLPTHGPGAPNAYTTVRDAIRDLPRIGNGYETEETGYHTPSASDLAPNPYLRFLRAHAAAESISDHVTSRHADYVLERYRQIPQGGNWEDISDTLTNYADVQRTHSNIYRRLSWNEPSITIGHYRKSMLIHPSQNRGLSLREAARLQSFPDWFRFCGNINGRKGGLMHKQQQLANAVCPLVTKSIAEYLLWL